MVDKRVRRLSIGLFTRVDGVLDSDCVCRASLQLVLFVFNDVCDYPYDAISRDVGVYFFGSLFCEDFIDSVRLGVERYNGYDTVDSSTMKEDGITSRAFVTTFHGFIRGVVSGLATCAYCGGSRGLYLPTIYMRFFVMILMFAKSSHFPPFFIVRVPFSNLLSAIYRFYFQWPTGFIIGLDQISYVARIVAFAIYCMNSRTF